MKTTGTIVHCCIDLDYIIHRGGAKTMVNTVRHEGAFRTEDWWIAYATILKAAGYEAMPTCTHYDRLGRCKGHPV